MPNSFTTLIQTNATLFKSVPAKIALPTKKTKTAGVAVLAEDTGRVLMLQRSLTGKKDGGKWEFPGGHVEKGEAHHEAAVREWEEETGIQFPTTGQWSNNHWISPDKKYMGLIYRLPNESDIQINPHHTERILNPDADETGPETVAWWHPKDLDKNPALREEAHSTPWHLIADGGNPYHDEKGRFTTGEGTGNEPAETASAVSYTALEPQKFSKDLRERTLEALNNPRLALVIDQWQHGQDRLARQDPTLRDAIHNAPATAPILYRGIVDTQGGVRAIMNKYKDGTEITLDPQSFSSSYGVAKVFTLGGETEPEKGTSVVFGVLQGSRALPIQNFASTSSFHSEKEFITGGKFRVIGADKNPDTGGVLVTLKQIEVL